MLTMEMVLHKDVDFAPKFGKNQNLGQIPYTPATNAITRWFIRYNGLQERGVFLQPSCHQKIVKAKNKIVKAILYSSSTLPQFFFNNFKFIFNFCR